MLQNLLVSTLRNECGLVDKADNAALLALGGPLLLGQSPNSSASRETGVRVQILLKSKVIWGHIDILVVVVRRQPRRWKVKTLLAALALPAL